MIPVLDIDVLYEIFKFLETPKDVIYFCMISKETRKIFKKSKKLLEIMKVDYKDPGNFVYMANNVSIESYRKLQDGKFLYNLDEIYKLYLKFYKLEKITVPINCRISSFPVYPKMKTFQASYNQLTSFPVQPKMTYFLS